MFYLALTAELIHKSAQRGKGLCFAVFRAAQLAMNSRPVFGKIDRPAGHHIVNILPQAGTVCQLQQSRQAGRGDRLAGEINAEIIMAEDQLITPFTGHKFR